MLAFRGHTDQHDGRGRLLEDSFWRDFVNEWKRAGDMLARFAHRENAFVVDWQHRLYAGLVVQLFQAKVM